MPPADYVTKELFEERHRWQEKWLRDLTEGFSELRNEVRQMAAKLDTIVAIEKQEAKTRDANRKALLGLAAKLLGSGGVGAGLLYLLQRVIGG